MGLGLPAQPDVLSRSLHSTCSTRRRTQRRREPSVRRRRAPRGGPAARKRENLSKWICILHHRRKIVNTDLSAGADVFFGVLVDEDVEPSVDHGCLQGADTHPSFCELWEPCLLLRLQHAALITLLVTENKLSNTLYSSGELHFWCFVNYLFLKSLRCPLDNVLMWQWPLTFKTSPSSSCGYNNFKCETAVISASVLVFFVVVTWILMLRVMTAPLMVKRATSWPSGLSSQLWKGKLA